MRGLLIAAVALIAATPAFAQSSVGVKGYYRSDGTYVQPHRRSAPDSSIYNNYSTKPNFNPYTGRQGTVDPYRSRSPLYGQPTRNSPYSSGSGWGDDSDD